MWGTRKMWKRELQVLLLGAALLGGAGQAGILVEPLRAADPVLQNDLRHLPDEIARDRVLLTGDLKRVLAPYAFSFADPATYQRHHQAMLDDLAALGFRRVWSRTVDGQGPDGFYSSDYDMTVVCVHWSDANSSAQAVYLVPGRVRSNEMVAF